MLTVRHIRHWYESKLPHTVFITGLLRDLDSTDSGDSETVLQN